MEVTQRFAEYICRWSLLRMTKQRKTKIDSLEQSGQNIIFHCLSNFFQTNESSSLFFHEYFNCCRTADL